jgi:CRISPR-associated protein Csm5
MKNPNFSIKLRATAISPIHIGTGQALDPFSYIIKDKILYRYNLNKLIELFTPEQRKQIGATAKGIGAGSKIEDAIRTRRLIHDLFTPAEHANAVEHKYDVHSKDFIDKYNSEISGGVKAPNKQTYNRQSAAVNQLEIQEIYRDRGIPAIPGSSLKGAVRTAFLKHLNIEDSIDLPFNMLSLPDCKIDNSRVVLGFFLNYFKGKITEGPKDTLTTYAEALIGGFKLNLNIRLNYLLDQKLYRPDEWSRISNSSKKLSRKFEEMTEGNAAEELFKILNGFYLKLLKDDYEIFKKYQKNNFVKTLDDNFFDDLENNKRAVIRLGRHSGREAMTIKLDEKDIPKTVWYFSLKNPKIPGKSEYDKNFDIANLSPAGWLVINR